MLNVSHERGDVVFTHAPNAAIYGNWLSSGTARRNAIPRAYSCEINGFAVTEVVRGTTKLDAAGGASSSSRLAVTQSGMARNPKGKKPSDFGFGPVPNPAVARAVSCELILRQGSISLKALDRFTYPGDDHAEQAFAAKRVYCLLAMAGHLLGSEDTFLRSGCDLVTVEERWGWRRHGVREPIAIDIPSLEEVSDALTEALQEAERVGLSFAKPVSVPLSAAELELITERVLAESKQVEVDES